MKTRTYEAGNVQGRDVEVELGGDRFLYNELKIYTDEKRRELGAHKEQVFLVTQYDTERGVTGAKLIENKELSDRIIAFVREGEKE